MDKKSCCFLGNDLQDSFFEFVPENSKFDQLNAWMHAEIETMIVKRHVRHFISGMDLCIGILGAEIVLKMKSQYPITLECVIPYEEQAAGWSEHSRNRYFSVMEYADRETMLQTRYTPNCISNRNRHMIDNSDYIIAVSPGDFSNAMGDIYYAHRKSIPIHFFKIP